jgi:hypothetical protein
VTSPVCRTPSCNDHNSRTVRLWDARAIGSGCSKGRGCLATLAIDDSGVWQIDWMRRADGSWLGAVAGM